jgi:hypothetical protein
MIFDLIKKFKGIVMTMSCKRSEILIEKLMFMKLDKLLRLNSMNFFGLFRDKLPLFFLNIRKKFSLREKIPF